MNLVPLTSFIVSIITSTLGIVGNSFLIYLVLKKTPQQMRIYSVLIFNIAICDLIASSASLFVHQRVIPSGISIFYISRGPCTYIGPTACFAGYIVFVHCFAHGFTILLYSFAYRYYILSHTQPKIPTVFLTCALIYSPTFLYLVSHFFIGSDVTELRQEAERRSITSYANSECISGTLDCFEWRFLLVSIYVNLVPVPVYVGILILRRLTILKMKCQTSISGATKQLHSQLLKVLTIQACLPTTVLLATAGYFIGQLDLYHHPILEYSLSFLLVPIPALNALVSLYFIGPYRVWISESLLASKKRLQCATAR